MQQISNMLSENIQAVLKKEDKHYWLTEGRNLSDHYKNILTTHGFSARVYTGILFKNKDVTYSQLRKLCIMLGIDIKHVV